MLLPLLLLLLPGARAERPDEGGLFSFDEADVLAYVDGAEGRVRVHYSVDGPNQTLLEDADASGSPDFAEQVAASAEAVLRFYEEDLGFRSPLSEAEVGLDDLGGSGAFDFYLVDFGGSADGMFSADACAGQQCAGFMVMENDFAGYGYASREEAVAVLTSHELFHAVQAAYNADQPVWMSEGTAVWAEHQFLPGVPDFYGFCSAYLEDPGRSIDSPPAGSVTAFSYGTALFFQFLTERFGPGTGPDLQAALQGRAEDEAFDAVEEVIAAYGGDPAEEWATFARWNLATGFRAGGTLAGYPFADELGVVPAEARGQSIRDDNRFYPLAATYYYLEDHPGGPISFATAEDASGLHFSLHGVDDQGGVGAALSTWMPEGPEEREVGEHPAGDYWLVGTYPMQAPQSVKVEFCLGGGDLDPACLPAGEGEGESDDTATPAPGEGEGGEKGCSHLGRRAGVGWGVVACLLVAIQARSRKRNTETQR